MNKHTLPLFLSLQKQQRDPQRYRTRLTLHVASGRTFTQGGSFKLLMTLPKDYPFKPPVLNFQTKIYHPNVSNDDRGSMCLGIVRPDEWKPPNRIAAVLAMTRSLLIEPNPDDAVEAGVAEQYKRDREAFGKTAREWVKRYASGKG